MNWTYRCPRCGYILKMFIDPKFVKPPVHRDEEVHHHNRPVVMELEE